MAEQQRLYSEMDGLRELLHTYEQSIERKDQVISNLTRGLQKQREKFEMMKTFSEWKISHNDKKREVSQDVLIKIMQCTAKCYYI